MLYSDLPQSNLTLMRTYGIKSLIVVNLSAEQAGIQAFLHSIPVRTGKH